MAHGPEPRLNRRPRTRLPGATTPCRAPVGPPLPHVGFGFSFGFSFGFGFGFRGPQPVGRPKRSYSATVSNPMCG